MVPPANPSSVPVASKDTTVVYLTDIEGRWEKLASFARDNPWVTLDDRDRLTVAPGALFVFGGDAIDRGPAGRRVVGTLLAARQRQPDRVVLIAGNRDINKLRLPRELSGHPPGKTPPEVRDGPRAALLQWIFANTMGAPEAFEHRRTELVTEGLASDDEAVTESFLTDLAPGGSLRAYLACCRLAFRHGPNLFVHGHVTPENLGIVPGDSSRIDDVGPWIDRLNDWYTAQMARFCAGVTPAEGSLACEALVAYQAPVPGTRANAGSVVYARPTDPDGMPYLPDPSVIDALRRAGIRRLLVGHTPSGDSPAVLRGDGFELVLADNSYGRVEPGSRVVLQGETLAVEGRTVLDNGDVVDVRYTLGLDDSETCLGLRDPATGHLVKSRLATGDYALFRTLPENKVEQVAVPPDALDGHALVAPKRSPG